MPAILGFIPALGASWWRWAAFRLCLSGQGVANRGVLVALGRVPPLSFAPRGGQQFQWLMQVFRKRFDSTEYSKYIFEKKNKHVFVCTTYVKIFNICFEIQIQSLTIVEVTYIFCRIIEIDYVVSLTTLDNACTPDGWLKLNLTG